MSPFDMVDKVIEEAMNQFPWDAGYRIDYYRKVAADLIELADGLEEDEGGVGCCGN